MSLGVIALLLFTPLAFAYAMIVFQDQLETLPILPAITQILLPLRKFIEVLLFIMVFVVAIYTVFLLSAMNSYPMLNTAVLPALFLFSALSAGVAANNLVSVLFFRADLNDEQSVKLHNFELPVIGFEILFLTLLFIGLYFQGGTAIASLVTGVWATVFWIGVVAIGFGIPTLSMVLPEDLRYSKVTAVVVALCSLSGVLALRHFILYAGQNYIS